MTDPSVAAASRAPIDKLGALGAEIIKDFSIPLLRESGIIWIIMDGSFTDGWHN
jgi:hypothetical protein